MANKITRDILESYLSCKYKGRLKFIEQQGRKSDYELLLIASKDTVRREATDQIRVRHLKEAIEQDLILTPAVLKRGAAFLLNVTLENDIVSLTFDEVKRLPGSSTLGDYHYVPPLFHGGGSIRIEQRLQLELYLNSASASEAACFSERRSCATGHSLSCLHG